MIDWEIDTVVDETFSKLKGNHACIISENVSHKKLSQAKVKHELG